MAAISTFLCILINLYEKFKDWRGSISNPIEPIPLNLISDNVKDEPAPQCIPINNVPLNPKVISTIGLNIIFWIGTGSFFVALFNKVPYVDIHTV